MGRTRRARGPGCRQRISSRDPSSRIRLRSTIRVIRAANWSRVTASEAHAESEESGRAARRASQAACASRMSSTRPPVARRVGPHLDQRRVLTAVPVGTRDLGDGSDEAHVRSSHHQHEITRGCRIGQLAQGDWIAPKHGTNTTIHAVYSSAMSTAHALLGLLEPAPRHGYALKRMFDRYFAPDRPLAFGQVYATLGLVGSRHDDVAVPREAAEGGVHLAEGERPVGCEVAVEHALEGVAVAWCGLEQAEQCVGGRHRCTIHCMYSRVRPMFGARPDDRDYPSCRRPARLRSGGPRVRADRVARPECRNGPRGLPQRHRHRDAVDCEDAARRGPDQSRGQASILHQRQDALSVQAIADGFNRERLRLGLPLIEVHVSAGGTASVSVKGKMLTDFPEFAVEWDTDKNGRGPEDIPAGHTATVSHWKCARGHRWEAKVGDRIIRLLRCRRCVTKRADETTSLVAVHPQLLAVWDDHSNLPLTPHTIRATCGTAVIWRCMAGLGHPTYKASIKKRFKDAVPCPLCRKMRPAHADALPSPDQRLVDLDSFDDLF